jgi:hypothetical protein
MRVLILLTVVLGMSGCASRTELSATRDGDLIAPGVAQAAVADVSVTVRPNTWAGIPEKLTEVTPLQVTIENGSGGNPLRLRYREFTLLTDRDRKLSALPPFNIRDSQTVAIGGLAPVSVYSFPNSSFYVAPYLRAYYPVFEPYGGPFIHDAQFYATHYPSMSRASLPTPDMMQRALPEGVVQPGGRITGFLYFEDLDDARRARFTFDLVDARSGVQFGRIEIPFRAR